MKNAFRAATTSLSLILFVALVLRVSFLWQYQHDHPRQAVSVVPFLFESGNIAHSLATGQGFASPFRVNTGPTAWMPPVYPLLLAAIFRIFGPYTFSSFLAAALFNIFCATFTCIPIFFAGKRIAGLSAAAVAAWLWAIFPNAILIPVESMWDASLSALLVAAILWATIAVAESQRARDWAAYRFLWGFTLLTNATLMVLLPLLLAWLAYRAHKQNRKWFGSLALSLGIVILCCMPWTIRNYKIFHTFVPLRSGLGLQLWLGNDDNTQDIFRAERHPIYDATERARYVQMGEVAYMHEKQTAAVHYMLSHPARETHLVTRRIISFWSGGTPTPLKDFLNADATWFRFVLLFNLLAALGALLGIIFLIRCRSPFWLPVAIFPLVFPWAYYLTLVLPRYRLPIDPVVLLLTAVALETLFRGENRASLKKVKIYISNLRFTFKTFLQIRPHTLHNRLPRIVPNILLDHRPIPANQNVRRQRARPILANDLMIRIQLLRPVHSVLRHKRAPRRFVFILADTHHLHLIAAIHCLQLF
jgi:4-amino-4-deoxy-L-arabinose transferase-like glycosyltransferase